MHRLFIFMNILVIVLAVLAAGCIPTVSLEDVYHSDATDPKLGGAKNIVVEQTPEGMKVSGAGISVIALITPNSFEIKVEPERTEVEYTIGEIALDQRGALIIKANMKLGEDSTVPVKMPTKGSTFFFPELYGFVPGGSNSQNVTVKINLAVGYTEVAGLRFKQEVVINVWEDGTVELNKKGIVASDKNGKEWISKNVKFGDKIAVIMVIGKYRGK